MFIGCFISDLSVSTATAVTQVTSGCPVNSFWLFVFTAGRFPLKSVILKKGQFIQLLNRITYTYFSVMFLDITERLKTN